MVSRVHHISTKPPASKKVVKRGDVESGAHYQPMVHSHTRKGGRGRGRVGLIQLGKVDQVRRGLERDAGAEEVLEGVALAGERVDDGLAGLDDGSLVRRKKC